MARSRIETEAALRRTLRELAERVRLTGGFSRYAARRFYNDQCFEAAGSLSYTSLLAIVPLVAVTLSVLTAFPAYSDAREAVSRFILHNLVPEVGEVVETYVNQFASAAVQLTAVGVVGLAVTAVLLLFTIEARFNFIWRVPTERPWLGRILAYWAILTLGPLLLGTSLSLSSRAIEWADRAGLGVALARVAWLATFFLGAAAFSALYLIIPNRSVRWRDGLTGGIVAAILFKLLQWGFGYYVTEFVSYQAVYGAIAALPIFLLWMYLIWVVVMFGAVIAAALPEWRAERFGGRAAPRTVALAISMAILDQLRVPGGRRAREIGRRLAVPSSVIDDRLHAMHEAGFVAPTTGGRWLIARDLNATTIDALARAIGIRTATEIGPDFPTAGWVPRFNEIMRTLARVEQDALSPMIGEVLGGPRP